MNMIIFIDIGIEVVSLGKESLFNLKIVEKIGILNDLAKGKKRMIFIDDELVKDNDIYIDENIMIKDKDFVVDADDLESELNVMYSDYKIRRSERDVKFRVK